MVEVSIISGTILVVSIIIRDCFLKWLKEKYKNKYYITPVENKKIPIEVVDNIGKVQAIKKEVVLSRPKIIKWLQENNVAYNVCDSDNVLKRLYNENQEDNICVKVLPAEEPKIDPDRLNN